MGEWGHRKGTDFERSIGTMLTCLGFEIVEESISIKCSDGPNHKCDDHSIDLLAKHVGPAPRPFRSYEGVTFFDCTSAEEVYETAFLKASRTLECLRKTDGFADTNGAIVVTARRMTPTLRDALVKYPEIKCWDLDHVSLYGAMATVSRLSKKPKYVCEIDAQERSSATLLLYRPVYTFPHQTFFGHLFYESDARMNRDRLRKALLLVRRIASRYSTTSLTVHSLSGFTLDIPIVLSETAKECSSLAQGIDISESQLFDYTRPWFAAFS